MNQSLVLTQNQALALGEGFLGGALATYGIVSLIVCIALIVAWWKLFTKAGEKGWKSLIPIYNLYVYCRIIGINFWIYVLAIPVGLYLLSLLAVSTGSAALTTVVSIAAVFYAIFFGIYEAIKLGDAFKKSTLFKVCIFFFAPICLLILAFGSSKYHGRK